MREFDLLLKKAVVSGQRGWRVTPIISNLGLHCIWKATVSDLGLQLIAASNLQYSYSTKASLGCYGGGHSTDQSTTGSSKLGNVSHGQLAQNVAFRI